MANKFALDSFIVFSISPLNTIFFEGFLILLINFCELMPDIGFLGKDYTMPIVDLAFSRKRALDEYKHISQVTK